MLWVLQYRLTIFFYSFLEQELSNLLVLTLTMPVWLAFAVQEGTIQASEGKGHQHFHPAVDPTLEHHWQDRYGGTTHLLTGFEALLHGKELTLGVKKIK